MAKNRREQGLTGGLQDTGPLRAAARREAAGSGTTELDAVNGYLSALAKERVKLRASLDQSGTTGTSVSERLDVVNSYFETHRINVEAEMTAEAGEPLGTPFDDWKRESDECLADWPMRVSLPIGGAMIEPSVADGFMARGVRRRLRRKARRGIPRTFSEQPLFRFRCQVRIAQLLSIHSLRLRKLLFEARQTLRSELERFKDELLVSASLGDESYWEKVSAIDFSGACAVHQRKLEELTLRLNDDWRQCVEDTCGDIDRTFDDYEVHAAIAGTALHRRWKYRHSSSERLMRRLPKTYARDRAQWMSFEQHFLSEWLKDIHLLRMQMNAGKYYFEILAIIDRKCNEKLYPLVEETTDQVSSVAAKVEQAKELQTRELQSLIKTENRLLVKGLREK